MQDQLDLLRYAKILETEGALGDTLAALPDRLARHCRWKMLLNAGRWWIGGSLSSSDEAALQHLRWVPPGAGIVASDMKGALELARLYIRRDRASVRIYRPDGRPSFTVLVPPRG